MGAGEATSGGGKDGVGVSMAGTERALPGGGDDMAMGLCRVRQGQFTNKAALLHDNPRVNARTWLSLCDAMATGMLVRRSEVNVVKGRYALC